MFLLLSLACSEFALQGTVVGNPGDARMRAAPPASDLNIVGTLVYPESLWLRECGSDTTSTVYLDDTEDIEVPEGTWCELALDFGLEGESFEVYGTGPSDSDFSVLLDLTSITLDVDQATGLVVGGQSFVFELGEPGWLSAELLNIQDGGSVDVADGHPLHDALSDTVTSRSALFADWDVDGEVGEPERASGLLASAETRDEDVADTGGFDGFEDPEGGCGCQEEELNVTPALLLLSLIGLRRRRRWSAPDA